MCNKNYAFSFGIRSMSPNVIVTDELSGEEDWLGVRNVINSGVKVIASIHGGSIQDIVRKSEFVNNLFDKYVVLKGASTPGMIDSIYNSWLEKII